MKKAFIIILISVLLLIVVQPVSAEIWPFSSCTADSSVGVLTPDKACNGIDNYPANSNDRWVSGGLNTDPHYIQANFVSKFTIGNISISWGDGASMVRFRIEARISNVWTLVFGESFGLNQGKVIPYNFTKIVQADAIKITGLDTSGASGIQIAEIYIGLGTTQLFLSTETILLILIMIALVVIGFKIPLFWLFSALSGFFASFFIYRDIISTPVSAMVVIASFIVLFLFMAKALGGKIGFEE